MPDTPGPDPYDLCNPPKPETPGGLSVGAILGICAGGALALAIVIYCFYMQCKSDGDEEASVVDEGDLTFDRKEKDYQKAVSPKEKRDEDG